MSWRRLSSSSRRSGSGTYRPPNGRNSLTFTPVQARRRVISIAMVQIKLLFTEQCPGCGQAARLQKLQHERVAIVARDRGQEKLTLRDLRATLAFSSHFPTGLAAILTGAPLGVHMSLSLK